MEYQQYLTDRFDPQRKYYSENSTKYQRNYKVIRIVQIILAASLPFAVAYVTAETVWLKIGTGAIGVLIAILEGIQSLYKWQDKGIEYRKASEAMKHERWLFQAQSGVYDKNTAPLKTFVERIEGIIREENKSWVAFNNVNVVNKDTPNKPVVVEEAAGATATEVAAATKVTVEEATTSKKTTEVAAVVEETNVPKTQ